MAKQDNKQRFARTPEGNVAVGVLNCDGQVEVVFHHDNEQTKGVIIS